MRSFNVDYRSMADELWTVFYAATPPLIGELRDAVERGDDDECRRLAHKLKGSSATVGATRMAALSNELEQGGPNGLAVVVALEAAYAGTRDELLRLAALGLTKPVRPRCRPVPRRANNPESWDRHRGTRGSSFDASIAPSTDQEVDTCLPRPPRRCTRCSKLRSTPADLERIHGDLRRRRDAHRPARRAARQRPRRDPRRGTADASHCGPAPRSRSSRSSRPTGSPSPTRRWSIVGTDGGERVEMSGRGTIVSRRQPDGSWRIVLDNP